MSGTEKTSLAMSGTEKTSRAMSAPGIVNRAMSGTAEKCLQFSARSSRGFYNPFQINRMY